MQTEKQKQVLQQHVGIDEGRYLGIEVGDALEMAEQTEI
jgi:hypothetical protein